MLGRIHIAIQVAHQGRLLVGTGPKGELWSLSSDGKDQKVVLDVPEKDVMSIVTIGDKILVGTSPKARLYMVDSELKGVLLHDFSASEVRDLALSGRYLVAAVNEFDDRSVGSLDSLTSTARRSGGAFGSRLEFALLIGPHRRAHLSAILSPTIAVFGDGPLGQDCQVGETSWTALGLRWR